MIERCTAHGHKYNQPHWMLAEKREFVVIHLTINSMECITHYMLQ